MAIRRYITFRLNRFLSALIDVAIFQFVGMVLAIVAYILAPTATFPIYLVPYFLFLNKDFLNGRGFGKRLFNHGVMDYQSRQPASIWQCFLRNLLLPFLIVEPLAMLINPERRLGDLLARTKVEEVPMSSSLKEDLHSFQKWAQLLITNLVSILYLLLLVAIVQFGALILGGS